MRGVVDDQLEAMGRSRRVIIGLPAFLPALAAVAASRALATLPARVARAFAPGIGLATAHPPIPVRRARRHGQQDLRGLVADTHGLGEADDPTPPPSLKAATRRTEPEPE
jgi:hypothetical protein